MSFLNKLKQMKDLRDSAKKMQNALSGETISEEKKGVSVTMNGNMEIISLKINAELSKEALAEIIKDCLNEAIKKTQRVMAKKMQEMGGLSNLMN